MAGIEWKFFEYFEGCGSWDEKQGWLCYYGKVVMPMRKISRYAVLAVLTSNASLC